MTAEAIINLIGLALMGLGLAGTGLWRLSSTGRDIRKDISDRHDLLHKALDEKIAAVYGRIESETRLVAEGMAGLRQQFNDEKVKTLEAFQNYVRRDSFHQFLEDQREARRNFEQDLKERLVELGRKVDRIAERRRSEGSEAA